MDQITNLLNVGLGALLPAFLLGLRDLQRRFAESETAPTWKPFVLPALMLLVSAGLAYGNRAFLPPATSASGLWWVQGALFYFALLIGDRAAETVYGNVAKAKEVV